MYRVEKKSGVEPNKRFRISTLRSLLMGLLLLIPLLATATAAAASTTSKEITISGRGWGHGRGMGQYGALGYAQQGWGSEKILSHYYSNTKAADIPANVSINPAAMRVNLRTMEGIPTTIDLSVGVLRLQDAAGKTIDTYGAQALRFVSVNGGYKVQVAPNCSGPWRTDRTISSESVTITAESAPSSRDGLLEVCGSHSTWYEGAIVATKSSSGSARTVNIVSVEGYLRGVVPNESPASWPAAALESQAVAARSYVIAGDTRFAPYAETCDTARCQVYDGRYTTRGGVFRASTHPNTDAAVKATSGKVRVFASGAVARTEFSSSTGGHTVEGDFPAVEDKGDATSSNPNSTWSTVVNTAEVENKYGKGALKEIIVVERDGLGADGGRVLKAEYRFEQGNVAVTGDTIRLDFGLKSNWFTVGEAQTSTVNDAYIKKIFTVFKGRSPNETELKNWRGIVAEYGREDAALKLAGDAHFSGIVIDDLYRSALGRESDTNGKKYWLEELSDGLPIEQIGVYFYGSEEYWKKSGGTNTTFVTALYEDVLNRKPDTTGKKYWIQVLDGKKANLDDVTYGFYLSPESRIQRASAIYRQVRGEKISVAEAANLAERLLQVNDLELAAELASSL